MADAVLVARPRDQHGATIGRMEDQLIGGLALLYLLAGAPGAGKTTLPPYLLRAAGGLVVMDMGALRDDDGRRVTTRPAQFAAKGVVAR
ncbi:hypothetical protein AB0L53_03365 [Nonomuraea sp. NPDC052129]|uniref:hypothetical protein n=1 Tax=Nonomuraea sp. NPDC052129 TaxID=3154651 RepID=UPI003418CFBA